MVAKAVAIHNAAHENVLSIRSNIFQMRNENSRRPHGTVINTASINAVASGPPLKVETREECIHQGWEPTSQATGTPGATIETSGALNKLNNPTDRRRDCGATSRRSA